MGELARGERLQIMLADDELAALDDWRFARCRRLSTACGTTCRDRSPWLSFTEDEARDAAHAAPRRSHGLASRRKPRLARETT